MAHKGALVDKDEIILPNLAAESFAEMQVFYFASHLFKSKDAHASCFVPFAER